MELVARCVAKEKSLKRYFTGKPCKYGHVSERRFTNGHCIQCEPDCRNNAEERKVFSLTWQRTRKSEDGIKAAKAAKRSYERTYYAMNSAKKIASTKAYRERNPELARSRVLACTKAKPEVARERCRRYQAKKRSVRWADHEAISMIYRTAEVAKEIWGDVEVDHILPINGKTVSGLHVPSNLQIVTAQANRRKHNLLFT